MAHGIGRTGPAPSVRGLGVALVLAAAMLLTGCGSSRPPTTGPGSPAYDPGTAPAPTATAPAPTATAPAPGLFRSDCPPTFVAAQATRTPEAPSGTNRLGLALPSGPVTALVCAYGPYLTSSPARLSWSTVLSPGPASSLLAVTNAAPDQQTDRLGRVSCVNDNGRAALLRFRYAHGPDQEVLVRLTGCQVAWTQTATTTSRFDLTRAVLALAPTP